MKTIQAKLSGTLGGEEGSGCGEGIGLYAKNMTQIITNTLHANVWLCVKRNMALITVVMLDRLRQKQKKSFMSMKLLS